ncbi:glycosyltransferase [Geminicoccaceae bacterium 1502E]|nr:glycosyltransferase [Geminicoccaceae bacterium 1502E]
MAGLGRPLRLLVTSSLYPSTARPGFGVFVENRLRHLVASGEAAARVVAPVPWTPGAGLLSAERRLLDAEPPAEQRHGIDILRPRYLHLPRIGMSVQPWLLYRALRRTALDLLAAGERFDAIDAHYAYPDGVAAALLARELGLKLVVTARGTDLNLIPRHALPRRWLRLLASRADRLVAVCSALADIWVELGADPGRVQVLRNGVDLDLFRPLPREALRARLGIEGPCLLAVGQLIPRKRPGLLVEALPMLPGVQLLFAGEGPLRGELEAAAAGLGVAARVRFLGAVPHERLPEIYNAADCLALVSEREGWANVLLEAMACGTPVVASAVWGTPEVVTAPEAGCLLQRCDPPAIAAAVRALLAAAPARAATRRYAEGFGWEATTRGQLELFRSLTGRGGEP